MAGGRTILEVLYGRAFQEVEMFSQPVQQLIYECLIYDNEIENEHIKSSNKPKHPEKEGNIPIIQPRPVSEILFEYRYIELRDAICTLLTTEEYLKMERLIDSTSRHND